MNRFVEARIAAGLSTRQAARLAGMEYKSLLDLEQRKGDLEPDLHNPPDKPFFYELTEIYECGLSFLDGTFKPEDLSEYSCQIIDQIASEHDRAVMIRALMMVESKDGPIEGGVVCKNT